MVEYSIPFDQASFKIVIKATGDKLEWLTYTKGKQGKEAYVEFLTP